MTSLLETIVARVEQELAQFYGFSPQSPAVCHVMTREQVRASLGSYAEDQPEYAARGGVWLLPTTDSDELFVGVHFDDDIKAAVTESNPLVHLSDKNLDAFCIVVEEISHFHLLLNRAQAGLEVSKLELEWQGEVDKLLLSGLLLEQQQGRAHVIPLARRLYDLAEITAADHELYWQATKYAARFWFDQARDGQLRLDSAALKERLRAFYRGSWATKLDSMKTAA